MKNKGQIAIHSLLSIAALLSAVGVPIFWASGLQATNTIQDNDISSLKTANADLKDDVKELRKGMNALLLKNGINPEALDGGGKTSLKLP